MNMNNAIVSLVTSAILGGIIWDVLKFPVTKLFYKATQVGVYDPSGYWVCFDVHSQKSKTLSAVELLEIKISNTIVRGTIYQLNSRDKFSMYNVSGFYRNSILSLCYEIRNQGIQTGTLNLHLSNHEDQHIGVMTGTYTEFYDTFAQNRSTSYALTKTNISLKQQLALKSPFRQHRLSVLHFIVSNMNSNVV